MLRWFWQWLISFSFPPYDAAILYNLQCIRPNKPSSSSCWPLNRRKTKNAACANNGQCFEKWIFGLSSFHGYKCCCYHSFPANDVIIFTTHDLMVVVHLLLFIFVTQVLKPSKDRTWAFIMIFNCAWTESTLNSQSLQYHHNIMLCCNTWLM